MYFVNPKQMNPCGFCGAPARVVWEKYLGCWWCMWMTFLLGGAPLPSFRGDGPGKVENISSYLVWKGAGYVLRGGNHLDVPGVPLDSDCIPARTSTTVSSRFQGVSTQTPGRVYFLDPHLCAGLLLRRGF